MDSFQLLKGNNYINTAKWIVHGFEEYCSHTSYLFNHKSNKLSRIKDERENRGSRGKREAKYSK